MKRFFPILLFGFSLLVLASCGTTASLTDKDTYVQYASIQVTESVEVVGKLISLDKSTIAISVDGAYAEYFLEDIVSYEWYIAPDPELMQRDIVRNTARTASNSGFFVTLTIISLAVTAILVAGQIL